jgi:8-oxo-dGTP pyrophosphatase MutT (NUDIX family)
VAKDFTTVTKKLVYENKWMQVYEHQIERRGRPGIYGVVNREHSVIVIPLTVSGQTILLKQYRYPTDEDSWELPMGGINANESTVEAASRELLEETGLQSTPLEQIGSYYAVPGLTPQRVTVFVAQVSDSALLRMVPPTDTDDIQTAKIIHLSEVFQMVTSGIITDGFSLAGLLFLKLFLEKTPWNK